MPAADLQHAPNNTRETPYDVIIVGAGLSGIGTAYWLQKKCPAKRYLILEARKSLGGTWDLFRYPGIRSDSDMFTFGYRFRPWQDAKPLSSGDAILQYIRNTATENGIDRNICFDHKALRADWSGDEMCWNLTVQTDTSTTQLRARFLYMCSGYFSYDEAHRPPFEGEEQFKGTIVLPQFWAKDLDYSNKRVVVIGSGATAVTMVPAMAETAAHVTMLQRSPTYIVTLPNSNRFFSRLKKWVPDNTAYKILRWRNLVLSIVMYRLFRMFPGKAKRFIRNAAAKQVGPGIEVEKHFSPRYNPWDQRLCIVPDGDFFTSIRQGKASVVTDEIAAFSERGIRLKSGQELEADIIVLATGLKIRLLGGAEISVNGKAVYLNDAMVYKGMMLSDVPNLALAFGYKNASWTLKTDLTANYICRLLNHMDRKGYAVVVPRKQAQVRPEAFLDFQSGYIQRANHIFPKQGSRRPWRVYQNYLLDMLMIRYGRIADGVLQFFSPK